ncbi:MAG: hypothetical protein GY869_04310 [Planctomycetes bacterium]|nr:hypothetical protein [Planctomycetota bacterium]
MNRVIMILLLLPAAGMMVVGCGGGEEAVPVEDVTLTPPPVETPTPAASVHPTSDNLPVQLTAAEAPAVIKDGNQETCPYSGGAIVKEIFADHDGKRVYFCKPKCVKKFNGAPGATVEQMESEGIILTTVELK